MTVEAHHATGRQDIEAALHDLLALLKEYAGGTSTSTILDVHHPALIQSNGTETYAHQIIKEHVASEAASGLPYHCSGRAEHSFLHRFINLCSYSIVEPHDNSMNFSYQFCHHIVILLCDNRGN